MTVFMPFACIFVPDFPMEAILRAEPELRSQAAAVLEGKPPLQTILAGNEKARRAGVLLGTTKLQVEGCTEIALRERSELQESAAHQALLDDPDLINEVRARIEAGHGAAWYAMLQIPLYQHVNGIQLTAKRNLVTGVQMRF